MAWQNYRPGIAQYRIKGALMLLAFGDNHDAALPALPGRVIQVRDLPEDERFVVVTIDGQEFHAFASDLQDSCEPVTQPASPERAQRLIAAA